MGTLLQSDYMIYPSGMLVARSVGDGSGVLTYTKHYFDGTQRISSKIGTTTNLGQFPEEWIFQENSSQTAPLDMVVTSQDQLTLSEEGLEHVYELFEMDIPTISSNGSMGTVPGFVHGGPETEQYFFHPDHLGSSNYITNLTGGVSQHMEYFAFGETFIEEHLNSNNSPYKFNGKELDEETGNYYFGARYYDPRLSLWISVDPLAHVQPDKTPYHFVSNNPINRIDPTGMLDEWVEKDGQMMYDNRVTDQEDATTLYGDGAIYRPNGYTYTASSGANIELGDYGFFKSNGQIFSSPDLAQNSLAYTNPTQAMADAQSQIAAVRGNYTASAGVIGFISTDAAFSVFHSKTDTINQIQGKWKFSSKTKDNGLLVQFEYEGKTIEGTLKGNIFYFVQPNDFHNNKFQSVLYVKSSK